MKKISLFIINFILLFIIGFAVYYLFIINNNPIAEIITPQKNLDITELEYEEGQPDQPIIEIKRQKPEEKEIKAIYVTAHSAGLETRMDQLIDFVNETELNAMVIDIKDYSGVLAYDSDIELVNELNTDGNLIKDLPALLEKLHNHGIYTIARQTVFQDPELTEKKPEWAVKNSATGGLWYDWKGLSWADPTIEDVWDYNLSIAQEAIDLGFNEINFDYIRFPSDGPMKQMKFANLENKTKSEVIAGFFEFLYDNLKDEPAYISGDLFGFTTEREDDMNIGQQIEDAALYFDYVCPMVYPSHYPSGYLNLANPAAHPYEVISHSIKKGQESLNPNQEIIEKTINENGEEVETKTIKTIPYRAKIRPWLQAFNMGAVYTPAMIDAQIKASNENGGYGYLLWNARNVYNYAPSE